jgi:hypothetical protein
VGERLVAWHAAQRSFAIRPDSAGARLCGKLARELNHHIEAEAHFRTWVRLSNDAPGACFALGESLIEVGKTDEGLYWIDRAIRRSTNRLHGHWRWTRLRALGSNTDWEAELAVVDHLLNSGSGQYPDQTHLCFCRALLLDRLGRIDEAMTEYTVANRRKRNIKREKPARLIAISRRRWRRSVRSGNKMLSGNNARPHFGTRGCSAVEGGFTWPRLVFIVGMPRSGTTLTERLLVAATGAHTVGEIFDIGELAELQTLPPWGPPGEQERVPLDEIPRVHRNALYLVSHGSPCVVDKMPTNFLHLDLISQWFPDAVIIHCRRDPRAVRWSCFTSNLAWPFCDLEACARYQNAYKSLMNCWRDQLELNLYDVEYEQMVFNPASVQRRFVNIFVENAIPTKPESGHRYVTRTPNKFSAHGRIHTHSVDRWRRYSDAFEKGANPP